VYSQPLTIQLDPRVRVDPGDLEAQLQIARMIDDWMNISYRAYNDIANLRAALAEVTKTLADKAAQDDLEKLDKELADLQEGTNEAPGFGAVNRDVTRFVSMIQSADIRPAKSIIENATPSCVALKNDLRRLREIYEARSGSLRNLKQSSFVLPAVPNDPRCPN
jgi:hypothetical protein